MLEQRFDPSGLRAAHTAVAERNREGERNKKKVFKRDAFRDLKRVVMLECNLSIHVDTLHYVTHIYIYLPFLPPTPCFPP